MIITAIDALTTIDRNVAENYDGMSGQRLAIRLCLRELREILRNSTQDDDPKRGASTIYNWQ